MRILRAVPELDRDNPGQMGWARTLVRGALGQPGPAGIGLVLALKPWRDAESRSLFARSALFDEEFSEEMEIAFTALPVEELVFNATEDDRKAHDAE